MIFGAFVKILASELKGPSGLFDSGRLIATF